MTGSNRNGTGSTEALRLGDVFARPLAGTAIFIALAVALGMAMVAVPNVELFTFTVFAAGVALGRARGALVGVVAGSIFSGLNPMGSSLALPPLFVAQVAAWALAGLVGGASRELWRVERPGARGVVLSAAFGLVLTVVYQCAVVAGLALSGLNVGLGLAAAVAANSLFSLLHIGSNTVLFAVLSPALLPGLARHARPRTGETR